MQATLDMPPVRQSHAVSAREGKCDTTVPYGVLQSLTLTGKTIGIVGLGQIGTSFARMILTVCALTGWRGV